MALPEEKLDGDVLGEGAANDTLRDSLTDVMQETQFGVVEKAAAKLRNIKGIRRKDHRVVGWRK